MEQTEISRKIANYIEENFIYDPDVNLDNEASLLDTGLVDSTGILEIVSFLEETFGITIEDEEMVPDNLDSVTKISKFITSKAG
jgi:acyl carrier protein